MECQNGNLRTRAWLGVVSIKYDKIQTDQQVCGIIQSPASRFNSLVIVNFNVESGEMVRHLD